MKRLISITGPTASGKTALALNLAHKHGLDILSFDSRQFYREIPIGTAQPTKEEQMGIRHWFISSHSIWQPLDVMSFRQQALPILQQSLNDKGGLVLVGGSGLYLQALLYGLDAMPDIAPELRRNIRSWPLDRLQAYLAKKDPEFFNQVDRQNPVRLMRAVEVMEQSGRPFSSFRTQEKPQWNWDARHEVYHIEPERGDLRSRMQQRLASMLQAGLKEEAMQWKEAAHLSPLKTVGYREWYEMPQADPDRVATAILTHTAQYAKRQSTWFRKFWETHPYDQMQRLSSDPGTGL